jgi:hypothetical protein
MPNSQGYNVSQSAWAMDAVEDFENSPIYTAKTANSGAAGELQNDYTFVHSGDTWPNNSALSCSNYGIVWDAAEPINNSPTFADGTGVQIGYASASSTSSLPPGDYKLSSEWGPDLNPKNDGYTLSIWANTKAIPGGVGFPGNLPSPLPGANTYPFVVSWPLFFFGREGSPAERGNIFFGLVNEWPSVPGSKINPNMTDKFKIMAYHNYNPAGIFTTGIDMAYSVDTYDANLTPNSNTWQHFVLSYDASAATPQDERWSIYLNGVKINVEYFMSPYPVGKLVPKNWHTEPMGDACSIGVAKKNNYPFELASFGGYMDPTIDTRLVGSSGQDFFHIFNGLLDEATIWSKALSPIQISEIYNSGRAKNIYDVSWGTSSLSSWYRFGDISTDSEGSLGVGFVNDLGPFSADAGNVTDFSIDLAASASIGVNSGSVVFSTASPLPGPLEYLRASPIYNRKQTLKSVYSVVDRHGVEIPEREHEINKLRERWDNLNISSDEYLDETPLGSIQPYGGTAIWEADRLAGHGNPFVSSPRSPFYDSYGDYSADTKYVFKGGTILSEFRISEKIENYVRNENFLIDQDNDFSIFGIPSELPTNPQNSSQTNFNKYYTNSEFMQFFDIVKTDHDGVATPSEITIKCRGLKKFIPYDGFYPSERSLQVASQFSRSYSDSIEVVGGRNYNAADAINRPVMAAMFSPGILYNSIKAGIAVDYPISISSVSKFEYSSYISGTTEMTSSGYWSLGTGSTGTTGWDYRVPFEALLEPEKYLQDKAVVDMEPDPSCSLDLVTKLGNPGDNLYKMMINNFLAEIPEFFLRNNEFTSIRSIPDNSKDFGKVRAGKTYGMRVKIRRSMNKTRRWFHPSFPADQASGFETVSGYELPQDPLYQPDLKETFTMYSRPSAFGPPVAAANSLSDPTTGSLGSLSGFVDNGRQSWAGGSGSFRTYTGSLGRQNQDLYPSDSLNGYNPSFTPPYYNGEAWADILYTAPLSVTGNVSLDDILNNSKVIYWRIDGRPILRTSFMGNDSLTIPDEAMTWLAAASSSLPFYQYSKPAIWAPATSSTMTVPAGVTGLSSYDPGDSGTGWHFWGASSAWNGMGPLPMAPLHANKFAMQLSASINLLGREDVLVQDFSADGTKNQESTTGISGRWVIQPKFETPMFNFGDQSVRPISAENGTLTIPTNGSESVPRGMWHQYGCLPRPNEGIYLEVADIPEKWIEYRGAYSGSERISVVRGPSGDVVTFTDQGTYKSEYYSDYGSGSGVSSLMDVAGFTKVKKERGINLGQINGGQKNISKKLGQLKQGKTVSEAIVAIPFYLEEGNQKLFGISSKKIQAILDQQKGITPKTEVNILPQIGPSLYDMVEKMQKFVLPPRYDFVNYSEVLNDKSLGAFAMYIFDFSHTFTTEDLSYIWQNVSPDGGLKSVFDEPEVESEIIHDLSDTELLDAEDFQKEIRWHVFKVKQRAATNYFEKTTSNTRSSRAQESAAPSYNWPYDFFSLIELGNMSTQVALKNENTRSDAEMDTASPDTVAIPKFKYKENQ